jgi:hypothetical protein
LAIAMAQRFIIADLFPFFHAPNQLLRQENEILT